MKLLPTLSFFARQVSQAREILRVLVEPTGSRSSVRGRFIAQPRVVTQVIARLLGGITWKAGKLVLTSTPNQNAVGILWRIYKNLNCVLLHVYHKGVKVLRRRSNEAISD
jgi:hypothetical protein